MPGGAPRRRLRWCCPLEVAVSDVGSALDDLLHLLDLEPLEVNLFRGQSRDLGGKAVFGGQVIGQALVAASRTVEGRLPHSLHAYFLRPGDMAHPIVYEVDRVRDGKRFTARRVQAIQGGEVLLSMICSFQVPEEGFEHQAPMPEVPPPESLRPQRELVREWLASVPEVPPRIREAFERRVAVEFRPSRATQPAAPGGAAPSASVLGPRERNAARRATPAHLRPRLRVGLQPSLHGADAARGLLADAGARRGQHRPRALVSPDVPGGRLAALRDGQPDGAGRARPLPWAVLRPGRAAGGERRAGESHAPERWLTLALRTSGGSGRIPACSFRGTSSGSQR